ncbi:MAG: hypothetical protein ABIZ80_06805, partial [Bryobacteraceae bacterium]
KLKPPSDKKLSSPATQTASRNASSTTRATNIVQLIADAGTGVAGSGTLGSAGTFTNSQCTLDSGASSVSGSGDNLTVNLAISFKPALSGAQVASMGVINNANVFSSWQSKGTWTVP